MNGGLKVVVRLPQKVVIKSDSAPHQQAKEPSVHGKKRKRPEEGRSDHFRGGSGAPKGHLPPAGPGIPNKKRAGAQSDTNGEHGAGPPKPRFVVKLPALRPPGAGGAITGPPQPPRPWQTVAQQQQPKPPAPVVRISSSFLQKPKKRNGETKDGGRPTVSIKQANGLGGAGPQDPGQRAAKKEQRPASGQRRPAPAVSGRAASESYGPEVSESDIRPSPSSASGAAGLTPEGPVSLRPLSAVPVPDGPAKKADIQRVIEHVQKKDPYGIFKNPVTEDMAPGYYTVVKKGMDFTTMWARLNNGEYARWSLVREDLSLMFNNAMIYNTPDTVYHKQARSLLGVANKVVDLASQGILDFRGRTTGVVRQHNAQLAAEQAQGQTGTTSCTKLANVVQLHASQIML